MVFLDSVFILASFAFSCVAVALILRLSHKNSWYDHVDERKIHTGDVPRLGGIGFAGVYIAAAAMIAFLPGGPVFPRFFFPLTAMLLMLGVGIYDDFQPLAPRYKLFMQILAGLLVVIPGYTFRRLFFFDIGPLDSIGEPGWLRYLLSFFWIVGLANAVNFIDGVDGLAGGVSALAALAYAVIFSLFNNSSAVLLCLCLTAVLGGFLVFNLPLPKARIFMGDGGSQFLGFMLAFLPLLENKSSGASLPLSHAAILLSIPIFDTFAAIWRRIRDRRRIDSPDRMHIHHKLMNLGLGARGVDGILYLLQIVLGILVFVSMQSQGALSLLLLGIAYTVSVGFFIVIHFVNRWAVKENGDTEPADDGQAEKTGA
jgi:UDP-GlcNAc:undecaprenyl-phosphate GlcNAc-1-phosphate transferase